MATSTRRGKTAATLALALTASCAIDATATAQETAWAWVSPSQARQYGPVTPSSSYSHAVNNRAIRVVKSSTGRWSVILPRQQSGFGVLHASAYRGNHSMVVTGRSQSAAAGGGAGVTFYLEAFDPSGQPVDGGFTLLYRMGGHSDEAYVHSASASASSAFAYPYYSFNSAGGTSRIVREGTGRYLVTIPGQGNAGAPKGGHVQVTAGTSRRRAEVVHWFDWGGELRARVRCTDPSGQAADSTFQLSFMRFMPRDPGASGFTYANNPTAGGYLPTSRYTDSWGQVAIQRVARGFYVVNFPGLKPASSAIAQVTAYGSMGEFATLAGWGSDGSGGTLVRVQVRNAAGQATDGRFNLLYMTDEPTLL